jgi:hypothetical protein
MNRDWSDPVIFLIIWHDNQAMSMPSNHKHALRGCIKVSFTRKSQDMLDDGQIKAS